MEGPVARAWGKTEPGVRCVIEESAANHFVCFCGVFIGWVVGEVWRLLGVQCGVCGMGREGATSYVAGTV